jgi:hypothetical protein
LSMAGRNKRKGAGAKRHVNVGRKAWRGTGPV